MALISEMARQLGSEISGDRQETRDEEKRDDPKTSVAHLRQLLPPQKIAPVQFAVANGRIVVAPQADEADPRDALNIKAAREQLLSGGQRILKELKGSNCDKRLIETVQFMHDQLASEHNIVQLGIANIGCDLMYVQFQAELPDAMLAMLRAQTVSISMYVGQFPDWHRFVENTAIVEIDQDEIARIHATAGKLAADLRANPDIADPEVPATLEWLSRMLADPANTAKRLAFAVLRTIENLVSKVCSYALDLLEQTARKSADGLSTAASKVIVVSLLSVALSGALGMSSIAGRVQEVSWIKAAAELVQKQIEELSK